MRGDSVSALPYESQTNCTSLAWALNSVSTFSACWYFCRCNFWWKQVEGQGFILIDDYYIGTGGGEKGDLPLGKRGMGCDLRLEGGLSLMLTASYGHSIFPVIGS